MNKQKSFTLIELLVVIVIIGILAGVIMISTSSSIDKANIAKSKAFSESIKNNLMLNLVSEWNFDCSGTCVADGQVATSMYVKDSWGNINGSINGLPLVLPESDCVSGSCLQLNSTTDYISLPGTVLDPRMGSMTIEGWIFATDYTYPGTRFPFGYACGTGISCWGTDVGYSTSGIRVIFSDGVNVANNIIVCDSGYKPTDTQNKWTHVVVVFNRTIGKIGAYINSTAQSGLVDISSVVGGVGNGSIPVIGKANGWQLYGRIDGFRVYGEALSTSQIKQNYIAGLNSMLSNGSISKQEYNERINTLTYDKE